MNLNLINNEQIADIEQATRGQSESDEWFAHRAGRLTSSRMKALCHTDPANPSVSLIKQICYPHLFHFHHKLQNGDVIMKVLVEKCILQLWKNLTVNFFVLVQD